MTRFHKLRLWVPRLLGIGMSLFLGLFALDAFSEGKGFLAAVPAFLMHLTPALLLLLVVAVAWRRPWVGGVVFIGLAAMYASMVWRRHPDWALGMGALLLVAGLAFLWSGCSRDRESC